MGSKSESSGLAALTKDLDLEKYDVQSVAADLTEVANVPKAFAATAWRAALVPIVIAIVTWVVFTSRMATWALLPYTLVATGLSLGVAAVLAIALFTRRQLDAVTDASKRVLGVTAEMHGDLAKLKAGDLRLTVRETASTLSSEVIFPMVEDMSVGVAREFLPGPFKSIASPVIGVPIGVVKKSVAAAIGVLPVDALDAAVELGDENGADKALEASVVELGKRYEGIQSSIEDFVRRAMGRSLVPVLLAGLAVAIPLVLWWLLGWALS